MKFVQKNFKLTIDDVLAESDAFDYCTWFVDKEKYAIFLGFKNFKNVDGWSTPYIYTPPGGFRLGAIHKINLH